MRFTESEPAPSESTEAMRDVYRRALVKAGTLLEDPSKLVRDEALRTACLCQRALWDLEGV